jgi:hypothetical protein
MRLDAEGVVVPAGSGSVLIMAAGGQTALKLAGRQTRDSIMIFEETAPAGTETTFNLPRQRRGGLLC